MHDEDTILRSRATMKPRQRLQGIAIRCGIVHCDQIDRDRIEYQDAGIVAPCARSGIGREAAERLRDIGTLCGVHVGEGFANVIMSRKYESRNSHRLPFQSVLCEFPLI